MTGTTVPNVAEKHGARRERETQTDQRRRNIGINNHNPAYNIRLQIQVIGGGLAGCAAAIAARQQGAEVALWEKSRFPRHKVCGEYLSPEIEPILKDLGVWDEFLAANPALIRRLVLHFGSAEKHCRLPERAFGLSRYCLDELLFHNAIAAGVRHRSEGADHAASIPTVLAGGRRNASLRGNRVFGFKAHFEGPVDDAIELFFFKGCYVGVNEVENGVTNVCGLGPESVLANCKFDIDTVVSWCKPLVERLRPLRRKWKWLSVGPLVFENRFAAQAVENLYPAGDALSFVDPFTGSGMLSALVTGRLAGIAAARGTPVSGYLADCRGRLQHPFAVASLLRGLLEKRWAERLSLLVPGSLLVHLTRPHRVV